MTSQISSLLFVGLSQQVPNITLDSAIIHRRQDRLNRSGLGEFIKLMATMDTRKLKNKGEAKPGVVLH